MPYGYQNYMQPQQQMFNQNSYMQQNPYQQPNYPTPMGQQPLDMFIRVSGDEGAKAFVMKPNSAVPLFHESADFFYAKTTDGAGFPTVRKFKFHEVPMDDAPQAVRADMTGFATVDDVKRLEDKFDRLYELLGGDGDGKQPVQQQQRKQQRRQ